MATLHPFRHGGLWWRIATELANGSRRFGVLFRTTRKHEKSRGEEKTRLQHAIRQMSQLGLIYLNADGFTITAHGVRELARINAQASAEQARAA